jgi:hypothetical protein
MAVASFGKIRSHRFGTELDSCRPIVAGRYRSRCFGTMMNIYRVVLRWFSRVAVVFSLPYFDSSVQIVFQVVNSGLVKFWRNRPNNSEVHPPSIRFSVDHNPGFPF